MHVVGTKAKAELWLDTCNDELDGARPIDVIIEGRPEDVETLLEDIILNDSE